MPKIRVFWNGLTDQEKRELLALLKTAGCEVLENESVVALAPEGVSEEPADDVLVVLITPACAEDSDLAKSARHLARSGGRLVGIWPKGETDGKIPGALERYGADVVTWDLAKVARAVGQPEAEPQWENAQGAARIEPRTKRNSC